MARDSPILHLMEKLDYLGIILWTGVLEFRAEIGFGHIVQRYDPAMGMREAMGGRRGTIASPQLD